MFLEFIVDRDNTLGSEFLYFCLPVVLPKSKKSVVRGKNLRSENMVIPVCDKRSLSHTHGSTSVDDRSSHIIESCTDKEFFVHFWRTGFNRSDETCTDP